MLNERAKVILSKLTCSVDEAGEVLGLWSRLTGRPKKAASWAAEERARVERIAAQQLAGVGIDDQARADVEPGGTGLHLRKATTDAEGDAVFRTPRGQIIAARHARGG